jgi:hypothetical protein
MDTPRIRIPASGGLPISTRSLERGENDWKPTHTGMDLVGWGAWVSDSVAGSPVVGVSVAVGQRVGFPVVC